VIVPRILVTGVSGQVGWELARSLAPLGHVICLDLPTLDFRHPETIRAAVRAVTPTIVVNPAAYTAVDHAEHERDLAFAINCHGPAILAEECQRLGALLVHYSTDYIFDGTKPGAYREDDPPNPLGVYGQSKLAGEHCVRDGGCVHLLLRTSWVYGARGTNFLLTMLRLGRERDRLAIVDDQIGAPTWARTLADVTAQMVGRWLRATPEERVSLSGTYHTSAAGRTSWCGFATAIFERAEAIGLGRSPLVEPIPTSAYPTPARRPMNSVLDNSKLSDVFGLTLPAWDESLTLCMQALTPAAVARPT
jgi:dTDP-4-dehydrorhamnose reductase